jgi:aspartate aminotransferase/aminotransferase
VREYKKKRDMVFNGLRDVYNITKPQGAFYFFIPYPFEGRRFMQRCLEHNLIVVPGSSFSRKDTHFRICYATDEATLQKAIQILRKIAQEGR